MNTGYSVRSRHQQSADMFDSFKQIELCPWNEGILVPGLYGMVGSIILAVLAMEDYLRRRSDHTAIKTEYAGSRKNGYEA